jgi:hypothetical protein
VSVLVDLSIKDHY